MALESPILKTRGLMASALELRAISSENTPQDAVALAALAQRQG
jgi:hypothetical protein